MGKKLGLQRELTTRERSILDYIRKKTWEDGLWSVQFVPVIPFSQMNKLRPFFHCLQNWLAVILIVLCLLSAETV